jgi:hypothetical protein
MPASLPEKLLELQWAVDHWDLTDGPIAEASDKQVKYILSMMQQAVTKIPTPEYEAILGKVGLSIADTGSYSNMQDKLLDLHWKEASTLIDALKSALGPGAGMVGDATPNQIGFIWKLVQAKDQQSVETLFIGLGYDLPISKHDLEGFKLSKANASKIIDSLQNMPAASAVAQKPKKLAGHGHIEQIEDLIIDKGISNPNVKKVVEKYGIKLVAGNIQIDPKQLGWDDAVAVIKELHKIKKQAPSVAGGADVPAQNWQRKQVFDLYTVKGGALNDKVTKILTPHGMKGPYTTAEDLPLALTSTLANTLIKQLKKLKMRKATKQQVGMALALMSQLGPAQWKHSDLSKKWPPKELRAASMMKRDSIVMKSLIIDLKKLLKQKW